MALLPRVAAVDWLRVQVALGVLRLLEWGPPSTTVVMVELLGQTRARAAAAEALRALTRLMVLLAV
jgi:hypothetical protein